MGLRGERFVFKTLQKFPNLRLAKMINKPLTKIMLWCRIVVRLLDTRGGTLIPWTLSSLCLDTCIVIEMIYHAYTWFNSEKVLAKKYF